MSLGFANVSAASDIAFPSDIIFIDRALGGHFGNLSKLEATGPWRGIAERYAREAVSTA